MTTTKELGFMQRKAMQSKLRSFLQEKTGKRSDISLKNVVVKVDTDDYKVTHISIDIDGEASREELKAASPLLKFFGI